MIVTCIIALQTLLVFIIARRVGCTNNQRNLYVALLLCLYFCLLVLLLRGGAPMPRMRVEEIIMALVLLFGFCCANTLLLLRSHLA